jgi:hypothetical protein
MQKAQKDNALQSSVNLWFPSIPYLNKGLKAHWNLAYFQNPRDCKNVVVTKSLWNCASKYNSLLNNYLSCPFTNIQAPNSPCFQGITRTILHMWKQSSLHHKSKNYSI